MEFLLNRVNETISPRPRKKSIDELVETLGQKLFHGKKVAIFGICGGQASGKTKIAGYFQKNIPESTIIAERDFFKYSRTPRKLSEDKPIVGEVSHWETEREDYLIQLSKPESYDYDKLIETLEQLAKGEKVATSYYDNKEKKMKERVVDPKKTKIILVEGYFIFSTQKMRDLFDMRFYTKVDDDIRFTRLILRENEIMKNDPKAIQAFCLVYQKYMKPSFESNIEVEEKYANLVLPNYEINDKEEIEIADDIMEFLLVGLQTLIHDTKKIHA